MAAQEDWPAALDDLLDRPVVAIAGTVNRDGSPQSSVIWLERRGRRLVFFADPDSLKVRNLRRDPRIVVVLVDPTREAAPGVPAYARLTGRATVRNGEPAFPDRLARAYGNPDGYPFAHDEAFVDVEIEVDRLGGTEPYAR
jgi:PPOX class probable F420-dependent enzyme